ncbi:MAG: helix-turn-helix domain-containing protein [Chitinophagaceae bacterium]|nr:MAG: helix-turn-helix domain-containing protein [Chitinophagaceae bacterium]
MEVESPRSVSEYNNRLKLRGFNAFQIESDGAATRVYSRKDFYKICLTTGKSQIRYADRSFEQNGTILFFGNPNIPYSWETISSSYAGYTCLFSEDFLHLSDRSETFHNSPFFKLGGTPALQIEEEDRHQLNEIFQKMIAEQQTDYIYRDDLIRNYIQLVIHFALKLQPLQNSDQHQNSSHRLTTVFIELLERQFPIESIGNPLKLRTAADYASVLNVHTNHLNRAVKEVTGRPTTAHIAERIIIEAKAMLLHTGWSISEIAYALGFEYPSYFNSFFKKYSMLNPGAFRTAER